MTDLNDIATKAKELNKLLEQLEKDHSVALQLRINALHAQTAIGRVVLAIETPTQSKW